MTTEFFCVFCGIRTQGNASLGDGMYSLWCPPCGGRIRFEIWQKPTKTDEEVEAAFQNTPLTDSQRGTKRFSSPKKKP